MSRKHRGPFEFERHEIAKALFDAIKRMGGEEWVAVRIRDEAAWEVCRPRSQEMMRRALATNGSGLQEIKDELLAMSREMIAADLADDCAADGIELALSDSNSDPQGEAGTAECEASQSGARDSAGIAQPGRTSPGPVL